MLKVIIADDEPHFRTYMQRILPWEKSGFVVKGVYKNGEEALREIRRTRPDIALLDINMPMLDGISLTERIKEIFPDMVIVFITGHSEFEYARKAMRLGVDEYLLKPFTKEELSGIMEKIKLKLKKQSEAKKLERVERKILKEELLKRWIHDRQKLTEEKFRLSLIRVDIFLPHEIFCAAVLEMDHITTMRKRGEDIALWKFAISNIAGEILNEAGITHVLFEDYEDRIIAIVNGNPVPMEGGNMTGIFLSICEKIKQYLGFSITAGIGTMEKCLSGLRDSYRNAMAALEEKFILGTDRILLFDEIEKKGSDGYFYRLDVNDRLLLALRKSEKEEIREILRATKERITGRKIAADHAHMIISGIMSICLSYVSEMNGKINEIYGEGFAPYSDLYHISSLESAFAFLNEVFDKTLNFFQGNYSKRGIQILKLVEDYITQNYTDMELSVEDVAAGVYLDSSYLRRVVSKHTGGTILDLITGARMKEAARLIAQDQITVSEISERVGYKEAGYFSKCFKKYYGVSPKQYINQCR